MKKTFPQGLAVWAIPVKETRNFLDQQIENLAVEFQGPTFASHLTVHSLKLPDEESVEPYLEKLSGILEGQAPYKTRVFDLEFGTSFFRRAYLRLEDQEAQIGLINKRIKEKIKSEYHPYPHLSLLYGDLAQSQETEFRKRVTLPKTIEFGEHSIIHSPPGYSSERELIRAWKVLWRG